MNNKLLSYEELVEKLKGLEVKQRWNKILRKHAPILKNSKLQREHQKDVSQTKKEINLILTAIHHVKEARKLYEYKRLHDSEKIRGMCTDNYLED